MIDIKGVKKYCCEDLSLIENYELAVNDKTQTWCCHHKNEIDMGLSLRELIENRLYYDRPASELIFVTKSEHFSIHRAGKLAWNSGKTGVYSEETLQHLSEVRKDKKPSDETKRKISESTSGEKNGFYNHHHTEETKQLLSELKTIWICPLKIAYLYNIKKFTIKKISEQLGVCTGVISDAMKKNNIPSREPKETSKGNTNTKNRIWITNGDSTKMIYKEDLDSYLEKGFVIGRKKVEN